MPNPLSRDEFECLYCNDTGYVVGTTETLCRCVRGNEEFIEDTDFELMLTEYGVSGN